jgi:hypothetical protein
MLATLLVVSCAGEATGPSSAGGRWRFDASYAGNGYSCTIAAASLYLQPGNLGWLGTITGGQWQCTAPPGEVPVPATSVAQALEDITVEGDSIAFALADATFLVRGTFTASGMAGTVQVATPFCQCTQQYQTGTWTATRP